MLEYITRKIENDQLYRYGYSLHGASICRYDTAVHLAKKVLFAVSVILTAVLPQRRVGHFFLFSLNIMGT